MSKEKLETKIKLTEMKIELIKELIDFNKKSDRKMIFVSVLLFLVLLVVNINRKDLGFITVFSISLFTTSTFNMIFKMQEEKMKNELELKQAESRLKFYKSISEDREL